MGHWFTPLCHTAPSTPGGSRTHISAVVSPIEYDLDFSDVFKEVERKFLITAVHFSVPTAGLTTVRHLFVMKILQALGFYFQCKFHGKR